MKMKNKMNKFVVGGIFCLSTIFATVTEVSAYTSMYFDSSVDTRNYQLVVSVKYEDSDSDLRGEDTYIRENSQHRSSNTSLWKEKFYPENSNGAYVPKKINVFDKWFRDPTSFTRTRKVASKKLTVPAMKLHLEGKESYVNYVRSDDKVARVLEDAVVGYERDNGNLSMIDGLNRILRRIETLKGGYQDETDFKTVLMALGHLFSGDAGGQVIIGVDTAGQSVDEEEKNGDKEEEKLEPTDEGYEGNGKDIYINMTGKGDTVKTITITQEGAPNTILFNEKMLIRADTGYRMSKGPEKKPGARTIKITFKGENDKTPRTYVNSNAFNDATIDPDDIAYIKITNLIAHALIKHEGGITATNAGGEMGMLERLVYGLIDGVLDGVEFGLGLTSIEDLVYNAATLDGSSDSRSNYSLGMYPKEWEPLITIVYTFVGLISVSVLVFSVLKVFYRMTLDSMNVGRRMELKDDIASILQTVAIMFIFMFVFKFIAQINYVFVTTVYEGLGGGSISLMSAETLGGSMISNIILRLVMVIVKVYINVLYVIRALNMALLIALAPAFITAVAFGKKDLFAKYIQEILGNIFLQSFHALFFLFIFEAQSYLMPTGDMTTGFTSVFTSVVLTFAVIPTTKMFKMLVIQSSLMHVGNELGGKFSNAVKSKGAKVSRSAIKLGGGAAGAAAGHIYSKTQEKANELSDLQTVAKGSKVYERLNQATSELSGDDKKAEMFKLADSLGDDEKKDLGKYVEFSDNLAGKGDKGLKKMERALKFTENVDKAQVLLGKGSISKKGQALAKMNKERKELHDSIDQFKDHMQANNFSKTWDLANMKKAPGVYDNSGDIEGSHAITNDFAKSLGFNEFNTNFDNSSDIDNGTAFEMITNSCGDIDRVKLPPKEMRENLPEEVRNAYNAVELIQDARKDIRACKTDEDRQKVVEGVNERLRKDCKVKQEGFVQKDIRNAAEGRMTVHMVGDRKVRGGMHKKGITLYAENSENKGRW